MSWFAAEYLWVSECYLTNDKTSDVKINFTYLTFNTFSAISSYFILVSGLQPQTIYYYYDAPSTTYHWFTYVDSWLHLAHKPLVSRGKFLFVNVSEMALEG